MEMGLSFGDEQRETLLTEEVARYEGFSDPDLDRAIRELEAWEEGGKWSDPAFVRDHLIYEHILEALSQRYTDSDDQDPGVPSEQEWEQLYASAVAEVDAIPEQQRARNARERERRQEQEIRQIVDSYRREATKEAAGSALSFFFQNYFGMFDLLFGFLAVGSAYGIASGRSSEE
jgi:hypothetical protein